MTRSGQLVLLILLAAALNVGLAGDLPSQGVDSIRAGVVSRADSVVGPPLSPGRAFLYSFLFPGYAQTILDRPTAGAIFVLVEGISIAMARKSAGDLEYAKERVTDSIISGFVTTPDPVTGLPIVTDTTFVVGRFDEARVKARRTHYEDWIALLIFNHLFAGADAFVAAHLWDLPARVSVRPRRGGIAVVARLAW